MATTQTHYDEEEKTIEDHLEVLAESDWKRADDMEKLLRSVD